jgi:hypothetical protein
MFCNFFFILGYFYERTDPASARAAGGRTNGAGHVLTNVVRQLLYVGTHVCYTVTY